ncbi:hypothetical protein B0H14DRAFT_2569293 [Mycena olivaceomarginata]|nr:hypothetical protein B0H14DRAFT_2569293 [Mycena olivaceomarginata]
MTVHSSRRAYATRDVTSALDPDDLSYHRYRGNLYRDDSTKLRKLLDTIMSDPNGRRKLMSSMRPHIEEFACEIVAEEMETRRRNSILPGIAVFTPDFIEKWTLDEDEDHSPFLTSILTTASQTERAKKYNKLENADKAQFGLFLWSTGSARQRSDLVFQWIWSPDSFLCEFSAGRFLRARGVTKALLGRNTIYRVSVSLKGCVDGDITSYIDEIVWIRERKDEIRKGLLFNWIFPPLVQAELDEFHTYWNQHQQTILDELQNTIKKINTLSEKIDFLRAQNRDILENNPRSILIQMQNNEYEGMHYTNDSFPGSPRVSQQRSLALAAHGTCKFTRASPSYACLMKSSIDFSHGNVRLFRTVFPSRGVRRSHECQTPTEADR